MKWYAASAIFVAQVQDQTDNAPLLVEERVYLVSSTDDDDAHPDHHVLLPML